MIVRKNLYISLILLVVFLGVGCTGTSRQAIYYTLSSIEDETTTFQPTTSPDHLGIGIGPIKFPDELSRSSIVTRESQNQLQVHEFHRWGGSLKKSFSRVMVENMAHLMDTDQVMARPWELYFQPDFRIALDIKRFDGRLGEYALLNTTWVIFEKKADKPAFVHRSLIKEPVSDMSYEAFVGAQSRALRKLCQEISSTLIQLKEK